MEAKQRSASLGLQVCLGQRELGGRTAAVLTSFISTCKGLGINPFAYLRDIFACISTHPQTRLAELLPDQ